jgi:hypothetical protein
VSEQTVIWFVMDDDRRVHVLVPFAEDVIAGEVALCGTRIRGVFAMTVAAADFLDLCRSCFRGLAAHLSQECLPLAAAPTERDGEREGVE